MAFVSVFITVLIVGGCAHLVFPFASIAACFALGSVLAPTYAVAITSLSDRISIANKLLGIINGEGLINDAYEQREILTKKQANAFCYEVMHWKICDE